MFCPRCGAKNLDDARFCCKCGNSLSPEHLAQPLSQSTQRAAETAQHKSKALLTLLGILLGIVLIIVVAILIIRGANENRLLSSVTTTISDGSGDDIAAYYDQYLPVSYADGGYTQGCHYDQFQLIKSDDGNTFLVTGSLTVTDISIDERPSYQIDISGTVRTNFLRTEYEVSWNYDFEEPEVRLPSIDISWVEGTYHQAHYYPMEMNLSIYDDNSDPETVTVYYTFYDDGEFIGDGVACYVGGNDLPRFEGEIYGSPISIEYDGYNFIVNSSSLGFEDISFFED